MMPSLTHMVGGSATMFHCDPWSGARVGKELGIGEFELLEIIRSKGIDTWTCSDKGDLVKIILSKPIATAAVPDASRCCRSLTHVGNGPKRPSRCLSACKLLPRAPC
jgi:hypothetical protein